jgi:hypothetical protein
MLKREAKRKPSREELLEAVLLRNPLVKESARRGDLLRLTAPLQTNGLRKLIAPRSAPSKSFELDAVGIWVWDQISDRTTVRDLVRDFAVHRKVDAKEAENSLAIFLRTLLQRNLITLIRA